MNERVRAFLNDVSRMGYWLAAALGGLFVVWRMAPHMAEVTFYKIVLSPAAAYVYYRLDRAISEKRRPHRLLHDAGVLRAKAATENEPAKMHELLREATYLETWARDRYWRRTILISAGVVALALAG